MDNRGNYRDRSEAIYAKIKEAAESVAQAQKETLLQLAHILVLGELFIDLSMRIDQYQLHIIRELRTYGTFRSMHFLFHDDTHYATPTDPSPTQVLQHFGRLLHERQVWSLLQ